MKIDDILKMEDETSVIIKLDELVNELSNYGEELDKLTEPQKVLLFVENLEREVNNGGFNQFYANSSGDFTEETLLSLKEIGAVKIAEILKRANTAWPNGEIPKERDVREELLEKIEEEAEGIWEQCDSDFYKYPDNIISLLFEYVKENKADFE